MWGSPPLLLRHRLSLGHPVATIPWLLCRSMRPSEATMVVGEFGWEGRGYRLCNCRVSISPPQYRHWIAANSPCSSFSLTAYRFLCCLAHTPCPLIKQGFKDSLRPSGNHSRTPCDIHPADRAGPGASVVGFAQITKHSSHMRRFGTSIFSRKSAAISLAYCTIHDIYMCLLDRL